MIVDQITYTKRHNEGNYSHGEYTVTATVEEGENALLAFLELKKLVQTAIEVKPEEIKEIITTPVEAPVAEAPPVIVPEVKAEEKKTRKPRTPKQEEVKAEGGVVVEETFVPVAEPTVKYDRTVDAHKQLLSSHLSTKYPTWKTKEGVKEFSASLVGKPFLTTEGLMVDSFKSALHAFFA